MIKLREELGWFADVMEQVMQRHDPGRGEGWKTADVEDLFELLRSEVQELETAQFSLNKTETCYKLDVVRKAANVANYAMMIAFFSQIDYPKTLVEARSGPDEPKVPRPMNLSWVESKTLPIMERLRQFTTALYGITRLPKREPIQMSWHDVKALHTLLAEIENSRNYTRESLREILKEMV